jgi:phosphoribosyl-dephospho-CoA transferase
MSSTRADLGCKQPLLGHVWKRHDLLLVERDAWAVALADLPAPVPLLREWSALQRPVIVRRRGRNDPPGVVPVGVPLPPSVGKLRVGLTLAKQAVAAPLSSILLECAAPSAQKSWLPTVARLLDLGSRQGVEPTVIGSLLWQYLTGLTYMSPQSDLDVLWPVRAQTQLGELLSGIAAIELGAPVRIDGELVFANGEAVQWRELHGALCKGRGGAVVVKSMDCLQLMNIEALRERVAA